MADNPPVRIYVNIIENRITFKIETTIKLLGIIKNKITKDDNGENVPQFKVTEQILVHSNISNNDCQHDSIVLPAYYISKKNHIFKNL